MQNPYQTPISAVLLVLEKDGQYLLQRKHENARHAAGCYGLPGGKIEPHETLKVAILRESTEELDIQIEPNDIRFVGVIDEPRYTEPDRLHIVFHLKQWTGTPTITEPTKHTELRWVFLDSIPENTPIYIRQALDMVHTGDRYRTILESDPLLDQ